MPSIHVITHESSETIAKIETIAKNESIVSKVRLIGVLLLFEFCNLSIEFCGFIVESETFIRLREESQDVDLFGHIFAQRFEHGASFGPHLFRDELFGFVDLFLEFEFGFCFDVVDVDSALSGGV